MQGLFKLGIVGSKEKMLDFIEKSKENEVLKDWVIDEDAIETDGGLRSVEGSGLEKFLDKYKLVIDNSGSGNINGIEEIADEISAISPELEVILLTQTLDYSSATDWFIYYCPSGEKEDIAEGACITKGEGGITWGDLQDWGNASEMTKYINIDQVLEFYKRNESNFDLKIKITKEILQYYIATVCGNASEDTPPGYDEYVGSFAGDYAILFDEFFNEKIVNVEYSYEPDTVNLPSLAYVSRLFGEKFVEYYRFIPQTFDNRFEGKVFVVTGEPDDYGRKKTEEYISKFGGIVRNALSSKTNYLVAGDYAGDAKIAKAKALGTPIIDVEAFEKMISE